MPAGSLDAADAGELAELLRFVNDWLATDPDQLGHLPAPVRRPAPVMSGTLVLVFNERARRVWTAMS